MLNKINKIGGIYPNDDMEAFVSESHLGSALLVTAAVVAVAIAGALYLAPELILL